MNYNLCKWQISESDLVVKTIKTICLYTIDYYMLCDCNDEEFVENSFFLNWFLVFWVMASLVTFLFISSHSMITISTRIALVNSIYLEFAMKSKKKKIQSMNWLKIAWIQSFPQLASVQRRIMPRSRSIDRIQYANKLNAPSFARRIFPLCVTLAN